MRGHRGPSAALSGEGPCHWELVCPMHETWSAATEALRDTLAQVTLATLAARDEAIEAGTYPTPAEPHRSGTRQPAAAIANGG